MAAILTATSTVFHKQGSESTTYSPQAIGSTAADVGRRLPNVTDDDPTASSSLESAAYNGKTEHEVEDYVIVCMLSVLALMGIGGNIVVLNVFSRPAKRDRACPGASATLYVLALAVADLVTCVVVIPFTVYMEYVTFRIRHDFLCKFYQFLITSNVPFSCLVMVAIAVDRYVCICHPLRQATLATRRRARVVVLLLAAFASALGVCVALMFGVYHRIGDGISGGVDEMTSTGNRTMSVNITEQLFDDDRNSPTLISPIAGNSDFETSAMIRSRGQNLVSTGVTKSHSSPLGKVGDVTSASLGVSSSPSGLTIIGLPPSEIRQAENGLSMAIDPVIDITEVFNTGYCGPNTLILDSIFQSYYQDFHTMMYLLCILTVSILYGLIYHSVLVRRARRQRLRSRAAPLPVGNPTASGMSSNYRRRLLVLIQWFRLIRRERANSSDSAGALTESVRHAKSGSDEKSLTGTDHDVNIGGRDETASKTDVEIPLCPARPNAMPASLSAQGNGDQRQSVNCQHNNHHHSQQQQKTLLSANLRTAAMLFVVTVVFVVTYTPAFLMALELVPYQRTLFYMYFVNSVSNPVIYSFMNRYFRQELRAMVCRGYTNND